MLDFIKDNYSNVEKGLFVMLVGILGVFVVLIIFFLLVKLLGKLFPMKQQENGDES